MLKVLIVDDEEWIRRGLRLQADWTRLGMMIAGEAADGREALRVFSDTHPDIVITDIRMPGMDGIALMEHLRRHSPEVRLIIISGYADFEYARKALSFSVSDYILKPVEEELLEVALKKAAAEIFSTRNERLRQARLRADASEGQRVIRERALSLLTESSGAAGDPVASGELLRNAGIDPAGALTVCIIRAETMAGSVAAAFDGDEELAGFALCNVLEELTVRGKGQLVYRNSRRAGEVIHLSGETGGEMHVTPAMLRQGGQALGMLLYAGQSETGRGIRDLPRLYRQAEQALWCAGMNPDSPAETFEGVGQRSARWQPEEAEIRLLAHYLEQGQARQAVALLEDLFAQVSARSDIRPESMRETTRDILFSIRKTELAHDPESRAHSTAQLPEDVLTPGGCLKILTARAEEACQRISGARRLQSGHVTDQIVVYVRQHFREAISLNGISARFFMNPAYVSRAFKQHTGHNFNDYVSSLRMEAALRLLADEHMRMKDIAEMVGYENVNYFLKKFRERYDCTPTEYRAMVKKV